MDGRNEGGRKNERAREPQKRFFLFLRSSLVDGGRKCFPSSWRTISSSFVCLSVCVCTSSSWPHVIVSSSYRSHFGLFVDFGFCRGAPPQTSTANRRTRQESLDCSGNA